MPAIVTLHQPHRLDIVAGKSPVAFGIEVAQEELVLQTELDASGGAHDLSRYKRLAPSRTFVIEENAAAGKKAVAFPVVCCDPVRVELRHTVRRTRIKRGVSFCGVSTTLPKISQLDAL